MKLLVICTANRSRSPMAAALLQARLAALDVPAEVTSAGFGPAGEPAMSDAVAAMIEIGIDLGGHRSTHVTRDLAEQADLLIGMTRQHVVDLALLAPSAWPRIFPLVDLVNRAEEVGSINPGETLRAWVRRIHGDRERQAIMSMRAADEVADPLGLSRAAYERTRDQLEGLVGRLAVQMTPQAETFGRNRARGTTLTERLSGWRS